MPLLADVEHHDHGAMGCRSVPISNQFTRLGLVSRVFVATNRR